MYKRVQSRHVSTQQTRVPTKKGIFEYSLFENCVRPSTKSYCLYYNTESDFYKNVRRYKTYSKSRISLRTPTCIYCRTVIFWNPYSAVWNESQEINWRVFFRLAGRMLKGAWNRNCNLVDGTFEILIKRQPKVTSALFYRVETESL